MINVVEIVCNLQTQKIIKILVTEAEYSAVPELCYLMKKICAIFLFMGVFVEYKIIVHVDNFG